MAIRKQNIGLQGGFGTFVIGRQATLMDDAWAVASVGGKNNAIGDLYSHMAEQSTNRVALRTQPLDTYHDVRVNEVMTYVSPNFSGFTLAAQYGKGKTDVSNNAAGALTGADYDHVNYGASANYANGPITAVFAYNNEKNDAMTTTAANKDINSSAFDRSSWLLAGTYNFGVVKVYGQWFDGERDGDAYTVAGAAPVTKRSSDMRGWELGLSAPITAQLTLLGSYYDTTNDRTDTAVATGVRTKYSADGNGYQLAAVYALSKRTAAYAAYGHETIDLKQKGAAYKDSADGRDFAVGIKHSF
jgi:predicted porin